MTTNMLVCYSQALPVFCPRLYKDDVALYGSRYYYYIWELPLYVLMGVLGGLLGALFIRINVWVTALRARYVPPVMLKRRVAEVCTDYNVALARDLHPGEKCMLVNCISHGGTADTAKVLILVLHEYWYSI
jgi:hypothetical protein